MSGPKEELKALEAEIERLEERRRAIYRASVEAPHAEKVCDDALAKLVGEEPDQASPRFTYPIQVTGITHTGELVGKPWKCTKPGAWVAIRPCAPECADKTYLGLYLGDFALQTGASWNPKTGVLEVYRALHNPAIWVFDLNRIVFGCESFWGEIGSPEEMRKITDADIQSNWYVQAMKSLVQTPEPKKEGPP